MGVGGEDAYVRPGPRAVDASGRGFTFRAFLTGLVLCACLAVALIYNQMIIQGSFMHVYFMDRGALFVFFVLTLFANPVLRALKRRYALRRDELLVVGLAASGSTTLGLGYMHGGLNLDRHFRDYSYLPFHEFIGRRLLSPSPVFRDGFLYAGLGVCIAGLLTAARSRLSWWPLHPVALPVSTITYTDNYFFSVFLAWGIKALVLKFGGARFYRRTVPFFIGVVLGEAVCVGLAGGPVRPPRLDLDGRRSGLRSLNSGWR